MARGGPRPGSGPKTTCECGTCPKCRKRVWENIHGRKATVGRRVGKVQSGRELEAKMIEFFKEKGWD